MDWPSVIHENTGHCEKSGKGTTWASIQCWRTCGATGIPPLVVGEWPLWKLVWRHLAKPSAGRTLDSAVLPSGYKENPGTQSWETYARKFKAALFVIVFKIAHMPKSRVSKCSVWNGILYRREHKLQMVIWTNLKNTMFNKRNNHEMIHKQSSINMKFKHRQNRLYCLRLHSCVIKQ